MPQFFIDHQREREATNDNKRKNKSSQTFLTKVPWMMKKWTCQCSRTFCGVSSAVWNHLSVFEAILLWISAIDPSVLEHWAVLTLRGTEAGSGSHQVEEKRLLHRIRGHRKGADCVRERGASPRPPRESYLLKKIGTTNRSSTTNGVRRGTRKDSSSETNAT